MHVTGRRLWRRLLANSSLRFGTMLATALLAFGFGGAFVLANPNRQRLSEGRLPPGSPGHPLGTDQLGRDVLAWTAGGVRTAILVSLSVVVLSGSIGITVGLAAGYFGRAVDSVLMRLVDLQLAVPPLLLLIAATAILPRTPLTVVLLISLVGWVPYARTVRAKVLSDRERGYVAAARLAGVGHWRIMVRHLLPGVATLVLVVSSLQIGAVLLWESSLSFLSLGINPPTTSLGFMIAEARSSVVETWWLAAIPGGVLVLLVVAANLIGDGLRDLFHLDTAEGT